MSAIDAKCKTCGGDVYYDEDERTFKCFACARKVDEDGNLIPPTPAPPPDRYKREYHIPRSLRLRGHDGSI